MKLEAFAVVGHPIGHTMSPFIHKKLFALGGLSPEYQVLDMKDLSLEADKLRQLDGINITIPHKQAIIPLLSGLDEKAAKNQSVNTVMVENGQLWGYTTDGPGCCKALANHSANCAGHTLLLGAGGAARAIAFELLPLGGTLTLAVRDKEKGFRLAEELGLGVKVISFTELEGGTEEYSLLINATSVGMYPKSGVSPVSGQVVQRCESIFDAVYNPHETALLQLGKQLGKNLIYGIEMLVYQAVAAHEIWYGATFTEGAISALCREAAQETAKIFGAG